MVTGLLAVVAIVATGCGGDDGGGSSVTKEEFIDDADAICKKFDDELTDIGRGIDESTTVDQFVDIYVGEAIPLFRDQVHELRDLDVPEEDAAKLDELWDELDSVTDEFEQALKDDPQRALSAAENPYADAQEIAAQYGFRECGVPSE